MFNFIKRSKKKREVEEPVEDSMGSSKSLDITQGESYCHQRLKDGGGSVSFKKTKTITKAFQKKQIRRSLEERRDTYYDDSGNLYNK